MKLFHELDFDPEVANCKKDFTGERFGHWTIIEKVANTIYMAQCDCGKVDKKNISSLQALRSSQCRSCYRLKKKSAWF